MPRNKRKLEEQPVPDPAEFVERYCKERKLLPAEAIGTSPLEKECITQAEKARQAYKDHRDDEIERLCEEPTSERSLSPRATNHVKAVVVADESGLTPAEKYARRLFNNRKSAAASRVYNEVLRREMSTKLQRCSYLSADGNNDARIRQLIAENESLRTQSEVVKSEAYHQKRRAEDLVRDLVRFRSRKISVANNFDRLRATINLSRGTSKLLPQMTKPNDYRFHDDQHPAVHVQSQDFLHTSNMAGQNQIGSNTQQSYGFSQPSASAFLNDAFNSQSHPMAQTGSQPQTEGPASQAPSASIYLNEPLTSQPHPMAQTGSQSQAEGPPSQGPSSAPRLVVQKFSNSMALSQIANEGDAKDFTTGMTCSQSLDGDEKSSLGRPQSMPMSHGMPINNLLSSSQLGSQPSQELPAFKGAIGSEENPLQDPDFFLTNSQGNSKSNGN